MSTELSKIEFRNIKMVPKSGRRPLLNTVKGRGSQYMLQTWHCLLAQKEGLLVPLFLVFILDFIFLWYCHMALLCIDICAVVIKLTH